MEEGILREPQDVRQVPVGCNKVSDKPQGTPMPRKGSASRQKQQALRFLTAQPAALTGTASVVAPSSAPSNMPNHQSSEAIRKTRLFTQLLVVMVFLGAFLPIGHAYADGADRDEEIRRAAEKLVRIDRADREAASRRYDEQHSSVDDSGGIGVTIVIIAVSGAICVLVFRFIAKITSSGNEVRPSSLRSEQPSIVSGSGISGEGFFIIILFAGVIGFLVWVFYIMSNAH